MIENFGGGAQCQISISHLQPKAAPAFLVYTKSRFLSFYDPPDHVKAFYKRFEEWKG